MTTRMVFRLFLILAAVSALLLAGAVAFAASTDSGYVLGAESGAGVPYLDFTSVGTFLLAIASSGTVPIAPHAIAPAYSVNSTVTPWIGTAPISGNFTTTVSPFGPLADVLEAAATAGNTPSQFLFTLLSGIIVLAGSLLVSWFWRLNGSNGTLFAKGSVVLVLMGVFIALRWNDFWMILFYIIFFAAFGMMSRHQSWQS